MAVRKRNEVIPAPESRKPDLDSFPNDALEEQLAADLQTIKGVEQELSQLVGPENLAVRWLRMLGRVLPNNARSAKSYRVDPLPNMSAERIQQRRQEVLQHSRAHAEEAKATLQWYKESPTERRDQLPPWLKTRAEALAELQVLLWRSSPEGRLATMSAGLERLRAVVEGLERQGSPDAAAVRERYNGCARMADLMRQFVAAEDQGTKDRLKREMEALEAEEAQALEAMHRKPVVAGEVAMLAAPEAAPASPLRGRWRVISVTHQQGRPVSGGRHDFIEFDGSGAGRFRLGDTQGDLDGKVGRREGKDAIDFSWEGTDGSEKRWGRGNALLEGEELHGMLFLHKGGEASFVAKKVVKSRGRTRGEQGMNRIWHGSRTTSDGRET